MTDVGGRFTDQGGTMYDFGDSFLVRCPRCGKQAEVAPPPALIDEWCLFSLAMRLTCTHCGLARSLTGDTVRIGGPQDRYFMLPLWLQAPCCGHLRWAYNARYLRFVERLVAESAPGVAIRTGAILQAFM